MNKTTNSIKCPHNHLFGIDPERFDDCDECKIFDACLDAKRKQKDDKSPKQTKHKGKGKPKPEDPPQEVFDYAKLLKHPKWQRRRLEVMLRDNFTCQLCQDIETDLHVHHKKYETGKKPWEYVDDDLITLCEDCHTLVEYIKEYEPDICNYNVLKITSRNSILMIIVSLNKIICFRKQQDQNIDFYFNLESENALCLSNFINKHINNGRTEG